MPKTLTFDDALDHFINMESAPFSDSSGAAKVLRGYIQRAITDQTNYEASKRAKLGQPELPEQRLRDYDRAEADILPHHSRIMKAVNNFPDAYLKQTVPIALFPGNERKELAGTHGKKLGKKVGIASVMVGSDKFLGKYTPEEAMGHELAHARDHGQGAWRVTDKAMNQYFDRMKKRFINNAPMEAYKEDPAEKFARKMQAAQKEGLLTKENYEDYVKKFQSEVNFVEDILYNHEVRNRQ